MVESNSNKILVQKPRIDETMRFRAIFSLKHPNLGAVYQSNGIPYLLNVFTDTK